MRSVWTAVSVLALLVAGPAAQAGGPLLFSRNGNIVKWAAGASTLTVTLDQGGLGNLTNAQADALVANVLGVWSGVPECTADLTIAAGELPEDVNDTNYTSYLEAVLLGYTPVVYDVDGSIIQAMYGAGQENRILGFAGPLYIPEFDPPFLPEDQPIPEGHVVLNGRFLDGVDDPGVNPELTQAEFESVIVHEFGHLLGLDHSQINGLDPTNDDQPTMFPLYQWGTAMRSLAPDDIGWISHLYPSAQFDVSFGSISGRILEFDGTVSQGYQGINVIARRIGGGRIDAGSCVSGCLYHAGYGPAALAGDYRIPGLPPGDYTVEIEEILDIWTGGSSVGPLDPPADFPPPAGHEFYDGSDESAWDDPIAQTAVTITAGAETANIDIVLNTQPQRPLDARQWSLYR